MVGSVNTNINAMAAVATLNMIGNEMTSTQSAIQSGLKVGAASDNPAVFTIAQGLRANINALSAVSDSLSSGTATIQAQTQGATAISNALTTLLQTVTQAQGQTGAALAASNATITNALNNINAYAAATTINGVNLLQTAGSLSILSNVSGASTTVTTAAASTAAGLGLSGLSVNTGGVTLAVPTANLTAGQTVVYTDSLGNSTTFSFATSGTASTAGTTTSSGTVGTDGNTYGSAKNVQVIIGATTSGSMGNLENALQANGVSSSISNTGVITINGGGVTAAGVTAAAAAGGGTIAVTAAVVSAAVTQTVVPGGTSAIAAVNAAINTIGATLSSLGAATIQLQGLSAFTSNLQSSVSTGLGAIVDANLSQESAQLSSLQTKQSLAIQSLTVANQGPSALLQLFR